MFAVVIYEVISKISGVLNTQTTESITSIYGFLLLINTLIFLLITSYSDLRTSLIDVRYVIAMVVISTILHVLFGVILRTPYYFLLAVAGGMLFLLIGYSMYITSMWGEGDAVILASTIYSFPYPFFVQLKLNIFHEALYFWYVMFFNMTIAGVVYSLLYAFVFSLKNRVIYAHIKGEITLLSASVVSLTGIVMGLFMYILTSNVFFIFVGVALMWLLYLLLLFSKLADDVLFTKKVRVMEVKEGDTVIGDFPKANFKGVRLDAITQDQINRLISAYGPNKVVEVKDMVRYIPSFLIGFLFTIVFGDVIFALVLS